MGILSVLSQASRQNTSFQQSMSQLDDRMSKYRDDDSERGQWLYGLLSSIPGDFDNIDRMADYYGSIYDKYHGTQYWDQVSSLPGLQPRKSQSGWDSLVHSLGFDSNYDKYMEELNQGLYSDLSQIASTKFENEYNSPSAQAARMRAAGQNPDLLGTSGVAGASEFNEPERAPEQGDGPAQFASAVGTGISIVESITNGLGSALALANNWTEFQSRRVDLDNKRFEQLKDVVNTGIKWNSEFASPGGIRSSDYSGWFDWLRGFSPSFQRNARKISNSLYGSFAQEVQNYDTRTKYSNAEFDLSSSQARSGAYRFYGKGSNDPLFAGIEALYKIQLENDRISNLAGSAKSRSDKNYYDVFGTPLKQATVATSDWSAHLDRNKIVEYEKNLKEIYHNFLRDEYRLAKKGSKEAQAFLFVVLSQQAGLWSGLKDIGSGLGSAVGGIGHGLGSVVGGFSPKTFNIFK